MICMIILKKRNSCQKNKKDAEKEAVEQRINCLLIRLRKDCKKRHTNLCMAWIDYKKVYDFVPHSLIHECMRLFGIADIVRNFLEKSMEQ